MSFSLPERFSLIIYLFSSITAWRWVEDQAYGRRCVEKPPTVAWICLLLIGFYNGFSLSFPAVFILSETFAKPYIKKKHRRVGRKTQQLNRYVETFAKLVILTMNAVNGKNLINC